MKFSQRPLLEGLLVLLALKGLQALLELMELLGRRGQPEVKVRPDLPALLDLLGLLVQPEQQDPLVLRGLQVLRDLQGLRVHKAQQGLQVPQVPPVLPVPKVRLGLQELMALPDPQGRLEVELRVLPDLRVYRGPLDLLDLLVQDKPAPRVLPVRPVPLDLQDLPALQDQWVRPGLLERPFRKLPSIQRPLSQRLLQNIHRSNSCLPAEILISLHIRFYFRAPMQPMD